MRLSFTERKVHREMHNFVIIFSIKVKNIQNTLICHELAQNQPLSFALL